jgi:hypothetical protein
LGADGFAGVEFGDGVGEAVGFVRVVERAYYGFDPGELFRICGDNKCVLAGQKKDMKARIERVANGQEDFIGVVLTGDVLEEDGFGLGVCVFTCVLLRTSGQLAAVGGFGVLCMR